jgi:hypothetical protein
VAVFIGQGEADQFVLLGVRAAYVKQGCALGSGPLEYRTYPRRDHVSVVAADSLLIADLRAWTQARFQDKSAPSNC